MLAQVPVGSRPVSPAAVAQCPVSAARCRDALQGPLPTYTKTSDVTTADQLLVMVKTKRNVAPEHLSC